MSGIENQKSQPDSAYRWERLANCLDARNGFLHVRMMRETFMAGRFRGRRVLYYPLTELLYIRCFRCISSNTLVY